MTDWLRMLMIMRLHCSESTCLIHTYGRRYSYATTVTYDEAGPIPKELGALTALLQLRLLNNQLEGV